MTEATDELTPEERDAITAHRRDMAGRVDDVLGEIEAQASTAEANGDARSAAQMRAKVPSLKRKREEILSGQRT